MRYLYSVLFYLALPFLFIRLLWRSRRAPGYRKRLLERLGFTPCKLDQCIWIHVVSVGETIAAIPLIKALKKSYPYLPILVTNMTPTGSARVKAALGETVLNAYIPYDLPDAAARFLDRVNPVVAVIVETELWPNLFVACKKRDIPVVVTNARLSEKSAQGYQRIASLTREIFSAINILSAQAQPDAERFIALGMPRERVSVTGNIKFDLELPDDLMLKSQVLRAQLGNERFIWIAASTHPSEEEIILAAHSLVREHIPDALLILVPRHPERFDAIADLVEKEFFTLARRSRSDMCQANTSVYLADTMGEMMLMYSVSDVAFVAGSFAPIGGHNMLEPAALQKPIITGPELFNFAEISELMLEAKGMVRVHDAGTLARTIVAFFNDQAYRQQTGENAYQVVEKNRGSLKRQLSLISQMIKKYETRS